MLLEDIALAKKMGEAGIKKVSQEHDSIRAGENFGKRIRCLVSRYKQAGVVE
jgi:hypothetical protein